MLDDLDPRAPTPAAQPLRVAVCSADEDLRAWILDELRLLTAFGPLQIEVLASLAGDRLRAADLALLVVGVDGLASADVEQLRRRPWSAPVIAIGALHGELRDVAFDHVLTARLTSRELKQAIRAAWRAHRASS